jgi:hypothetical protein
MSWATVGAIVVAVAGVVAAIFQYLNKRAGNAQTGMYEERERQRTADDKIARTIRNLDANSVLSDDEAFGSGKPDNDVSGGGGMGPSSNSPP